MDLHEIKINLKTLDISPELMKKLKAIEERFHSTYEHYDLSNPSYIRKSQYLEQDLTINVYSNRFIRIIGRSKLSIENLRDIEILLKQECDQVSINAENKIEFVFHMRSKDDTELTRYFKKRLKKNEL